MTDLKIGGYDTKIKEIKKNQTLKVIRSFYCIFESEKTKTSHFLNKLFYRAVIYIYKKPSIITL